MGLVLVMQDRGPDKGRVEDDTTRQESTIGADGADAAEGSPEDGAPKGPAGAAALDDQEGGVGTAGTSGPADGIAASNASGEVASAQFSNDASASSDQASMEVSTGAPKLAPGARLAPGTEFVGDVPHHVLLGAALPSATLWRSAAWGGSSGPGYPWGSAADPKRCNSREAGRGAAVAVDDPGFERGRSTALGLWHVSGNVAEWALDENGDPVALGGSFRSRVARCGVDLPVRSTGLTSARPEIGLRLSLVLPPD